MKKRILTLMLSFLLLFSVLALSACNGKGGQEGETSEETQATNDLLGNLPNADMGNRDFVLLSNPGWMYSEADYTGDAIHDTNFARYNYLNERYNIKFTFSHHEDTYGTLKNSQMGGLNSFDLMYPHPNYLGSLMSEGMLTDLRTLSMIDFSAAWHNASQVENYTANGKTYLLASDTTIDSQAMGSIVYNRDRYAALGFTEDLYQTVYDGHWTMEKFATMVEQAAAGSEGNGYALCLWDQTVDRLSCAMGADILRKNADGKFEMGLENAKMTSICNQIYDLIFETEGVIHGPAFNATLPTSDFFMAYKDGNSLFLTMDVGSLYNLLRDLKFDIGYLPQPKLDETQKDYRIFSASGMLAIPSIAMNVEHSGIILEALAVYSNQYLKPAFIDTILLGRLSENAEDFEMLSYLHSIKYYDFGYAMDLKRVAMEIVYVRVVRGQSREIVPALRSNASLLQEIATNANNLK